MTFTSSVLSFPNRGPWGDAHYRGNTSGHIVMGFLEMWHKDRNRTFVDPMEGSGTSRDVAKEMGIPYKGFDIKTGFDILHNDLLTWMKGEPALSAFLHLPYKDMIAYGGGPNDLSASADLEQFLEVAELALMNTYRALLPGGHYAILMGNQRRAGKFWPLSSYLEAMAPGEEVMQLVKIQHNTTSGRNFYGSGFVPTDHEMLYIFKKPTELLFALDIALWKDEAQARAQGRTWRNLVRTAFMDLTTDHVLTLEQLYDFIEGSEKAKTNTNWQAKVRQTVQRFPEFNRVSRGQYAMFQEG